MKSVFQSLSVRDLIEFVFLSGDLRQSFSSGNRLLQGAAGHRNLQSKRRDKWQNEVYVKYHTEFPLITSINVNTKDDFTEKLESKTDCLNNKNGGILIHGRIDGILTTDDITIVEEIKTYFGKTEFKVLRLNDFIDKAYWFEHREILFLYKDIFNGLSFLHWAQVLIYAFIYLKNNNLKEVICRVNYLKINSVQTKTQNTSSKESSTFFEVLCSERFLEIFFNYTLHMWLKDNQDYCVHKQKTIDTLSALQFPFSFRSEQRKMSIAVYKTITQTTNLFTRAPTGTGKTIATLFPALKAMGEEKTDKIFYLTAKTIGRNVAEKSIQLLQKNGAHIRYSVMTAKEKACFKEFALCDPEFCEYTVDYYKKQKQAFIEAKNFSIWNYYTIKEIAQRFELCPFEFSLYLSQHAEIVICDYNYVFDPIVYIKRLFDKNGQKYTFLIDEAHNLPERAREMYSREISSDVLKEWIAEFPHKGLKIYKKIVELKHTLVSLSPQDKDFFILPEYPSKVLSLVENIALSIELKLNENVGIKKKKEKAFTKFYFMHVYFQLSFLLGAIRSITDEHIIYYKRELPPQSTSIASPADENFLLKIFCINPRKLFAEYLKLAKSTIFFSATLHPFNYFCDILAEKTNDSRLTLLSPFNKEKFGLYIYTGINTLFKNRENSFQPLAELIYDVCSVKSGNYLIYFPSFSFMSNVFKNIEKYTESKECPQTVYCQKPNMTEAQKEDFLALFDDTVNSKICFAVLGGIFGEGIDLFGSKLIGCMIISVGLPSLGNEKDLIKMYYDQLNHKGFEYAYVYPGFNKVMQAAGRVIRNEEDKGFAILIDQRYAKQDYIGLYPPDWHHYKIFYHHDQLVNEVKDFWG